MLSGKNLKKKLLISACLHFLTFSYNLNTAALYFCSADNFFEHMGYTDDRLTSLDYSWQLPALIAVSICDSILFASNQVVFPKRLEKMFCHTEDSSERSSVAAKLRNIGSGTTGVFKAIIMSSSLLALLNSLVGFEIGLGVTLALMPGNFLAELSILFEPYLDKLTFLKSPTFNRWFSRYCSFSYGVSNGALYFNAIDISPRDIGWLYDRVIDERNPVGYSVLSLYALASLHFAAMTAYSFNRRIQFVLKDKSEKNVPEGRSLLVQDPIRFRERCSINSVIASSWKTIVTSLSLIALTHVYDISAVGYPLAAILLIGNFVSQETLYARDDEEVRNRQSWGSFFSSCCDSRRTQEALSACSLTVS